MCFLKEYKPRSIPAYFCCPGCVEIREPKKTVPKAVAEARAKNEAKKATEPKKTVPKKTEPKKTEPKKTVPKTTKVSCVGICGKKHEKTDMKTMDGIDGLVCDGCEHLFARPKKAKKATPPKKEKKATPPKPKCGCDKGACKRNAHKDFEGLCAKCSQGNCDCKKGKGGIFQTQFDRRADRAEIMAKGLEAIEKEHCPLMDKAGIDAYNKAVAEFTKKTNNPYERVGLVRKATKAKPISKKVQEARAKRSYKMTMRYDDDAELLAQKGFKMIDVENIHQKDGWGADEDTVRNGSKPSIKRVAYKTMAEAFTRMEQLKDKFARGTLYNQETHDYGNPDEWTIYWGRDAVKGGGFEIRRHAECKNQPPSKTHFLSRVFVPIDAKVKMLDNTWDVKSSEEEEEPTTPTLPTTETIVEGGQVITSNPTLEWLAESSEDEE